MLGKSPWVRGKGPKQNFGKKLLRKMYSNTGGMSRRGFWIEAKDRVEYGRRGGDGGRYLPFPSRRRNEVEIIRAMYGRRPVVWAPLFVHILTIIRSST